MTPQTLDMHREMAAASAVRIEQLVTPHLEPDVMDRPDWRLVRRDLSRVLVHTRAIRELVQS